MKRVLRAVAALLVLGAVVFMLLTRPEPLAAVEFASEEADLENGERMFWAGGCASCHADPDADEGDAPLLSGGLELETPFGTFVAPNISSHETAGIGGWSTLDFVNAMARGVSPDGRHYYPAFPYTYYQRMRPDDLRDLKAFIDTLPASDNVAAGNVLQFPYGIRRGLGLWKRRYLDGEGFEVDESAPPDVERGRYLVQGPGHCGACHTPRDRFGGAIPDRYLAGTTGENAAEEAPNITPHENGIGSWSKGDIAYSLATGFDPDFDSFGGGMVKVQENLAKLVEDDRDAIAAYLKSIQPLP
ncbi:MAG: cytochrome c [Woeseiaceae bacterium]|nr:cytochrome c [Woeseiaceae bacterium]